MYDVVPGTLQRLREADIVSMAGLMVASLGQEYFRKGAVHTTKRQGALLSGIVEVSNATLNQAASTTNGTLESQQAIAPSSRSYLTEVELQDNISCIVTCSCKQSAAQSASVCSHAAALLYYWLAHPLNFEIASDTLTSPVPPPSEQEAEKSQFEYDDVVTGTAKLVVPAQAKPFRASQTSLQVSNTAEILAQSGLSELRAVARAYEITTNGLNKPELAEAIVDVLKHPDAIRRVVATLEKQQRQLLAALTLAAGSMNDEDLRGLYDRFSLGGPGQLQDMLHVLQSKALIIRATFNNSLQRRIGTGLSGSALEVFWYVPAEVRAALHVTIPITPFTIEKNADQSAPTAKVQQVEPFSLLADLLLVARALEGKRLDFDGKGNQETDRVLGNKHSLSPMSGDGSIAVPSPNGTLSPLLLEYLQAAIPRPLSFLRFAFRVLRLADILYFEHDTNDTGKAAKTYDNGISQFNNRFFEHTEVSNPDIEVLDRHKDGTDTWVLHALPNTAELLLGSSHIQVAYELFTHWLNRAAYDELFDLQDEGLRLRCRATMMIQPALRSGELEIENMDARQTLIALLAQTPVGEWINFSTFARFVYRLNPGFLQKRQRQFPSPHWWIEQEEGRILHSTQFGDWMRAEGRYLAQLLHGPLYWWGICDVVLSPDDRLLAFQLTPLANIFLNEMPVDDKFMASETPGSADLSMIDVLESGDFSIPCTFANWPLIESIERFAEVKGIHAARLCYRLTPRSLSEAFARGESPNPLLEILHSLAEYQHTIAPDGPRTRFLEQLERRIESYGRVRFYTEATLLEAADQQVVRELSATTSLNEQIVRPIQPALLILKKNAIDVLVDELKRRGLAPLLHDVHETPLTAASLEAQNGSK